MDIDLTTVRHMAKLAKLRPDLQQQQRLLRDMGKILEFFDQLAEAQTQNIPPMAHPVPIDQRLREDVVTEPDRREDYQQQAPVASEGLYRVPAVLESE